MQIQLMKSKLLEWLSQMNYSVTSKSHYTSSLNRIAEYYQKLGVTEYDPIITADFIDLSHSEYARGSLYQSTFNNRRKCAYLLDEYFHFGKFSWHVFPKKEKLSFSLNSYYDEILKEFSNYWSKRGVWCKATLRSQVILVRQFLEYLQIASITDVRKINIEIISEYLGYAKLRHPRGLNEACAAIRYLGDFFNGVQIVAPDLRLIAPVVPTNRTVMPSFSDDEVSNILSSVDRSTASGKRDYAMLLLSAKLGLRAIDVANLKLTDIDWNKPQAELRFAQHKTGGDIILPLENDVGNAIADYIISSRPQVVSEFIFCVSRPPYREVGAPTVSNCTKKYMKKAGVECEHGKGSHSFRRHLATKMLNADVSYDKICEVLGHRQPHNLKSYVRADSHGLSECALSFTEICRVSGVLE